MRGTRGCVVGVTVLIVIGCWMGESRGQTLAWNNPLGGDWNAPGNWTPAGPPTLFTQYAQFNLPGAYGVNFTGATSVGTIELHAGTVAFSAPSPQVLTFPHAQLLNGHLAFGANTTWNSSGSLYLASPARLTLSNTSSAWSGTLLIDGGVLTRTSGSFAPAATLRTTIQNGGQFTSTGSIQFGGGSITITAGQLVSGGGLDLGNQSIASGTLTLLVDGAASSISSAAGSTSIWASGGGDASITFRNGASGSFGHVILAAAAGSVANALIGDGAGVTFDSLRIGNGGQASVTLTGGSIGIAPAGTLALGATGSLNIAGGTFSTGSGSTQILSGGRIVHSAGSFLLNSNLDINGGRLDVSAPAGFVLAPGRLINILGGGSATFSAPMSFSGNGAVVTSGTLLANSTLTIGGTAPGSFTVNGGALSSAVSAEVLVGNGAAGSLTLASSGIGTIGGTLHIGAAPGTAGSLLVGSGAALTVGSLNVGAVPGSSGTSILDHAASRITVGRAMIGNAGSLGGVGAFVMNGGTFAITNAAGILIDQTGRLEINAGTLTNAGPLSVAGGELVSAINLLPGAPSISIGGGSVQLVNGGSMPVNGSLWISSGGDLAVSSGSLTVGVGTGIFNARLNVSGPGSSLAAPTMIVGALGGVGSVIFADGASATITELEVGVRSGGGLGNGSVEIVSGANVTVSNSLLLYSTQGAQISVSGPGSALQVPGTASIGNVFNSGTLTVANHAAFGAGMLAMGPTGILRINGGAVAIGGFQAGSSGSIDFASGTLSLPYGYSLNVAPGGLLGANVVLGSNRALYVPHEVSIAALSTLQLGGGTLNCGTINGAGAMAFESGRLGLTGAGGLIVGPGNLFGSYLEIGAGRSLGITSTLSIATSGQLLQSGGVVDAGQLSIAGVYVYDGGAVGIASGATIAPGGALQVATNRAMNFNAPLASSGAILLQGGARIGGFGSLTQASGALLSGDGTIAKPLLNQAGAEVRADSGKTLRFTAAPAGANAGRMNLLGGTLDFTGPLVNASTGTIGGRGTLFTAALTNHGTLALSAGFSDLFGPLINQFGGRTIVTGGSTSTFYGNVTNAAGSEMRVSTGSTAVFLGAVSGISAMTGSGTVIFEGAASLGELARTGITVVDSTGSLVAGHARENTLIVRGQAAISVKAVANDPSGTSVVRCLSIESPAKLDLTNNSMVIDCDDAAGPLVADIRQHLQSGRLASSVATPVLRIGYGDNAVLGKPSFAGQVVDSTSVLLKFTFGGDTNLDGMVDITDLGNLATNWQSANVWTGGDFNYDGFVDITDLGLLATNWQAGVSHPLDPTNAPRALDAALASVGLGGVGVPEPAGLQVVGGALALRLLRRRRDRREEKAHNQVVGLIGC